MVTLLHINSKHPGAYFYACKKSWRPWGAFTGQPCFLLRCCSLVDELDALSYCAGLKPPARGGLYCWIQVLRVYARLSRPSPSVATNGTPNGPGNVPPPPPRVLHPGCGSSKLGVVLQREHGFAVVNADFSEVCRGPNYFINSVCDRSQIYTVYILLKKMYFLPIMVLVCLRTR